MPNAYDIRFVSNDQINRSKWDQCIDSSAHPLLYAKSLYLDQFCPDWQALVLNDYQAVMPLTGRIKWGIQYLYQPFLCAQLGVFGGKTDQPVMAAFLQNIPRKYRYIDICLNAGNDLPAGTPGLYFRDNYVLSLKPEIGELTQHYRENTLRNIRKAEKAGLTVETGFSFDVVIKLARKEKRTAGNGDTREFLQLHALLHEMKNPEQVQSWGVRNKEGEWIATALFFFHANRAYYILVGNTPEGRESGASHLLIHSFIEKQAGTCLLLDFEGSDVPGLAFFYSGFGATLEKYPCLKWNRLPWFLKWVK